MNLPFKVCPECGVEHVHSALVCSDCQVALVLASEVGEAPPPAPLPSAAELTRVAVGSPWEMERLALELQQAGISSRVDAPSPGAPASRSLANTAPRGSGARLALYVLPDDAEPAAAVIRGLLLEDPSGEAGPARLGEAGPAREGEAREACPACGAPIAAGAAECADCGLAFVAVEEPCSFCGAAWTPEATACPRCGRARSGVGAS